MLTNLNLRKCWARPVLIMLFTLIGIPSYMAQEAGIPDKTQLVSSSQVIVTGVVEEMYIVVWSEKFTATTQRLPNGQWVANLPSGYTAGRLYTFRVEEVVKSNQRIRGGSHLNIFIPGEESNDSADLQLRQEDMLFISKLKPSEDEYAGTILYEPGSHTPKGPPFDPETAYELVGGSAGILKVEPKNYSLMNKVRNSVRASKHRDHLR
jgi:hypothetical protein